MTFAWCNCFTAPMKCIVSTINSMSVCVAFLMISSERWIYDFKADGDFTSKTQISQDLLLYWTFVWPLYNMAHCIDMSTHFWLCVYVLNNWLMKIRVQRSVWLIWVFAHYIGFVCIKQCCCSAPNHEEFRQYLPVTQQLFDQKYAISSFS